MRGVFLVIIIFVFGISLVFAQGIDLLPIMVVGDSATALTTVTMGAYPEFLADDHSGVDLQRRMADGLLQDVSIRAGIFEDANVSLNGIILNNPQTGHFNLSLPAVSTDLKDVDTDLNGQALNFLLDEPSREGGYFRAASGNGGYIDQAISLTKKIGSAYHRISLEGMRTDGLRDETDGYRAAGSYLFSQKALDRDVLFYASVLEKQFGANGAYAAPWYMKEEEKIEQDFLMGTLTFHQDLDVTFKPYIHRTQDTFWLDRDNKSGYRNDHTTYVVGNIFEIFDPGTGRFLAFDVQQDHLRSTNLGERKRHFYSGEAGLKTQYDERWNYAGAVKVKYFDEFPFEILPRLQIGYRVTNFWKAHLKAERLYRQPSYTELYYVSSSNQGNANLNPQTSDNVELGVFYKTSDRWFGFNAFYRHQKDTIDWVRNASETQYLAINAGKVNVRGFDLSAGVKYDLKIFDCVDISYTRLDVNKEELYDISKYVFDYLRDRVIVTLSAKKGRWEYQVKPVYEQHLSLGSRFIVDAEVKYHVNDDLTFFALGKNIFDDDYQEYPGIDGEPFFVKAGLELRF